MGLPNNEHAVDRVIRVVGGLALAALLFVGPVPGWGLIGLVGLVFVATGLIGTCPIYLALGISTRSAGSER
jgi:hypothetical protein